MKNKIKFTIIALFTAVLLLTPVQAQQISLAQPSNKIMDAVTIGDWHLVRAESITWHSLDSDAKLALFLADVATSVTHEFDTAFKTLTKYDVPYSELKTCAQLNTWVDSLLKSNNENTNFLILKASLQIKGYNDMTAAGTFFEQARTASLDNEFVLINLGNWYGSSNRTKDAKEMFDIVLKKNSSSAGALNGLGMLAMSKKNMSVAKTLFEKAVKSNGAGPMEWFNLGSLYYYQKQLQDAQQALEKAVKLSPKMVEARFNLAGTYYATGQKSDCIEQLKTIVEIAPTSATGKRASKNLEALGLKKVQSKIKPKFHTVKKGETLYNIARRYQITVAKIQELNELSPNQRVYPGIKLRIKE